MKFISLDQLRSPSADLRRQLAEEGELIVTSDGEPIAILAPTDERQLEQSLRALRQARAAEAVGRMQRQSTESGRDQITPEQIEAEIADARLTARPG